MQERWREKEIERASKRDRERVPECDHAGDTLVAVLVGNDSYVASHGMVHSDTGIGRT